MASKNTYIIRSEAYDITEENIGEKLADHFGQVIHYININKIQNVKLNTRIEGVSGDQSGLITTDILEEIKKASKR